MEALQRAFVNKLDIDPLVYQESTIRAIKAFKKYGTYTRAAQAAGVSLRELKIWLARDLQFKWDMQDADESVTDGVEETAISKAREGDSKVLIHILASRNKRYAHKQIIEQTQTLDLTNVVEKMRQIAIAQPTLKPMLVQALQMAIERIQA